MVRLFLVPKKTKEKPQQLSFYLDYWDTYLKADLSYMS